MCSKTIPDSLYSRRALMITGRRQAGMTTFYEAIIYTARILF
jgi:hypothetical protein